MFADEVGVSGLAAMDKFFDAVAQIRVQRRQRSADRLARLLAPAFDQCLQIIVGIAEILDTGVTRGAQHRNDAAVITQRRQAKYVGFTIERPVRHQLVQRSNLERGPGVETELVVQALFELHNVCIDTIFEVRQFLQHRIRLNQQERALFHDFGNVVRDDAVRPATEGRNLYHGQHFSAGVFFETAKQRPRARMTEPLVQPAMRHRLQ